MTIVRKSTADDLHELMAIYREGREIMLSCGNVNQWKPGYPDEVTVRRDIELGQGYVVEQDGKPVGAFALIFGPDPAYGSIEGGEWMDEKSPYATIHRLSGTKASHGVAATCFEWCWEQIHNLRIDTHEDNVIMRHCIGKAGFRYCGIIHLLDGNPRLAFQRM